jgi:hypothetical protein
MTAVARQRRSTPRRRRIVRIALWVFAGTLTLLILVVVTAFTVPGVMFVLTMFSIGLADPTWPSISDGDAVVRECRGLMSRVATGEIRNERVVNVLVPTIPPEHWPPHIRALGPLSVQVDHESCSLMISTGGALNPAWGFGIYTDPGTNPLLRCDEPPRCGFRNLWQTEHAAIIQWEDIEP